MYVDERQHVRLNEEHSDYQWLTFQEAVERVALPGNDTALVFVEKHFAKRRPADWQKLMGHPSELVRHKVIDHLDIHGRHFIELSPDLLMSTADANGE